MTEREAFYKWMKGARSEDPDFAEEFDSYSGQVAWQAACKWQREMDAEICFKRGMTGMTAAILNQGKGESHA